MSNSFIRVNQLGPVAAGGGGWPAYILHLDLRQNRHETRDERNMLE